MRKEEILLKREDRDDGGVYSDEEIFIAMDEYAKQEAITFLIWKSEKGYYAQGITRHTTNDDPCWIRQENQLIFSNPISTNKLYELYQKSNLK